MEQLLFCTIGVEGPKPTSSDDGPIGDTHRHNTTSSFHPPRNHEMSRENSGRKQ